MAKEKFERNKMHINVGTIGHVVTVDTTLTLIVRDMPITLRI